MATESHDGFEAALRGLEASFLEPLIVNLFVQRSQRAEHSGQCHSLTLSYLTAPMILEYVFPLTLYFHFMPHSGHADKELMLVTFIPPRSPR